MTNNTIAELLVLFLIFISNLRFFIPYVEGSDSLAVVPLAALIISIASLFAFGLTLLEIVILLFSLFVFIINIPYLYKLSYGIIIDYYNSGLKILSLFLITLTLAMGYFVFTLRPMKFSQKKFGTETFTSYYSGDFENGFEKTSENSYFISGKILNITGDENNSQKKIMEQTGRILIFFIPPKTSSIEIYIPLLHKLAKDGYTIWTGEFNPWNTPWMNGTGRFKSYRKIKFLHLKKNEEELKEYLIQHKNWLIKEYETVIEAAELVPSDKVFLLADEDQADIMKAVYEGHIDNVYGYFDLANTEYNTKGYGPVENTEPILAKYLGAEYDRSGYLSSHLALKFENFISEMLVSEF